MCLRCIRWTSLLFEIFELEPWRFRDGNLRFIFHSIYSIKIKSDSVWICTAWVITSPALRKSLITKILVRRLNRRFDTKVLSENAVINSRGWRAAAVQSRTDVYSKRRSVKMNIIWFTLPYFSSYWFFDEEFKNDISFRQLAVVFEMMEIRQFKSSPLY